MTWPRCSPPALRMCCITMGNSLSQDLPCDSEHSPAAFTSVGGSSPSSLPSPTSRAHEAFPLLGEEPSHFASLQIRGLLGGKKKKSRFLSIKEEPHSTPSLLPTRNPLFFSLLSILTFMEPGPVIPHVAAVCDCLLTGVCNF